VKSVFMICLTAAAIFILAPLCFSMEQEKGHICFYTIDSNGDNRVSFKEFVKYLGDDRERFTSIDRNQDGELTHEEYHDSLGHGASEQEQETD